MRASLAHLPIARPKATGRSRAGSRRLSAYGAVLLALGLVGGCNHRPDLNAGPTPLRGTAYVVIGSYGQEQLSQAVVKEQKELVELLESDFRQLHPGVKLEVTLARESLIARDLAASDRDGLAPDLLLVSGTLARELHQQKLTQPATLTPELARLLRPHLRDRITDANNQLVGVPMLLEPQLACFNRKRLASSPRTLAALEATSERGIEVGMPINPIDLYWTVGAMGANDALIRATQRQRLTPKQQQALLIWLRWLRSANLRERVNFFSHQEALLQGLMQGQLDWITCRSTSLRRLRQSLGERLGVAVLPSGPAGAPTPLMRQRVWVLGRDSSPTQKEIAAAFTRFSLSPMMQRFLTLHTQEMLPVNREVSMPSGSSPVLQAMVASERQSHAADGISNRLKSGTPRLERLSAVLLELIYGERTPEQTRSALVMLLGGLP